MIRDEMRRENNPKSFKNTVYDKAEIDLQNPNTRTIGQRPNKQKKECLVNF